MGEFAARRRLRWEPPGREHVGSAGNSFHCCGAIVMSSSPGREGGTSTRGHFASREPRAATKAEC